MLDPKEVSKALSELCEEQKVTVESTRVTSELIAYFSRAYQADLSPVSTVIGGFIGQEVEIRSQIHSSLLNFRLRAEQICSLNKRTDSLSPLSVLYLALMSITRVLLSPPSPFSLNVMSGRTHPLYPNPKQRPC